jgi:hypothetical protein
MHRSGFWLLADRLKYVAQENVEDDVNHIFAVFTNAVEGREDDFNSWYSDIHLKEIVGLHGFRAAQRFVIDDPKSKGAPFKHLAMCEIDEGMSEAAKSCLNQAQADSVPQITDSQAPGTNATWFRLLTTVVTL